MSAAHMMRDDPELRSSLPTMTSEATDSIKRDLLHLRASFTPVVRVDLVFAVLALGTSPLGRLHLQQILVDRH